MQITESFNLSEFSCKDEFKTPVPKELVQNVFTLAQNLQVLRDYLGVPIIINSGYRTQAYNASLEGSAKFSQHLLAKAADIKTLKYTPEQIHESILKLISEKKMYNGGLGIYNTFVHYDIREKPARWDLRK